MNENYLSVVYNEKDKPKTIYPKQLVAYLIKRFGLKTNDHLLEIGFGRGEFLCEFKQQGLVVFGVDRLKVPLEDIKTAMIDVACERLPFVDAQFDVVYHKSLLEHLSSAENLMKETYRVLKPGGQVIILTPDWVSQMKVFYEDYTHVHPYDRTALLDLLKVFSFKEVQVELFYQLPLVWRYPFLKGVCRLLQLFLDTPRARFLARFTGLKFFRWSVELMVLGSGRK